MNDHQDPSSIGCLPSDEIRFEITGLDSAKLKMGDSKRGETAKPVAGFEGGNVVMRRREGWEDVQWEFGYDS
ncbi:hypothetical protein V8F06_005032 [Rhypophila decipiens]